MLFRSCSLCDSIDYTVHGILQARTLEWVAFPFSRGSPQPSALKSPAAFHEQRRSLERARVRRLSSQGPPSPVRAHCAAASFRPAWRGPRVSPSLTVLNRKLCLSASSHPSVCQHEGLDGDQNECPPLVHPRVCHGRQPPLGLETAGIFQT